MKNKYKVDIDNDGNKFYFKNDLLHRDGDLPAVEFVNGHKEYYKNGKFHRDNDLPAVEYVNGYKEYWIDGRQLTKEEVKKLNVKWVKVQR